VDNLTIARMLYEIAELMGLKQENKFKVRAYERAARAVSHAERSVSDMLADGTLESVPNIGKSTASLIQEIHDSGSARLYRALKAQFPAPILGLLDVPGLGYTRAAQLYEALGVSSVEDLEAAARAGQVRTVKGFTQKSEEKLLRSIETLKRGEGRVRISEAAEVADDMLGYLQARHPSAQISLAGPLRRSQETMSGVHFVAASDRPSEVLDSFTRGPLVTEVEEERGDRATVRERGKLAVTLYVTVPAAYGAMLSWFTATPEFLRALQQRAAGRGLELTEHGLYRGEQRVAGATEDEIFSTLALPWIPPENRNSEDDLAWVERAGAANLVELDQLRGDLHAHTDWSDGVSTLDAMAEAARARGYEYLAITDHSPSLKIANGLSIERLQQQIEIIDELNKQWPDFRLLKGCECDILDDGKMDLPDDMLAQLDIVVGSIHSNFKFDKAQQTERMLAAMENPYVDIIGHPTGRLILGRSGYELDWEQVIATAVRTGTALELNSYPDRLDIPDVRARAVQAAGGVVSIDSDSHSSSHLRFVRFGVGVARRGRLGPAQVLNARPLEQLLASRKRSRLISRQRG
jgi:DNA polymerase (family 10)